MRNRAQREDNTASLMAMWSCRSAHPGGCASRQMNRVIQYLIIERVKGCQQTENGLLDVERRTINTGVTRFAT